jgi:hypothetical protein
MALSGNTKAEIGFKKAVGVANTQYSSTRIREFNEESIKTAPSLSSFTIFGEEINKNPLHGYGSTVGTGLYYTDNVVEKLRLELESDPATNIGEGQSQAYYAKLPSDYSGRTSTSFSGGTFLKDTLGKLQIVPPLFGNGYDYLLLDKTQTQISKLDTIDWYLDPYNGVLFVQSPPQNFDGTNLSPGFIECFIYAGKMLNEVSPTGSTGGNAFISNEPYNPATWSGDTVSGATRQALYNKINLDNNNFINFTASTNSRFNEINTYTSNTQTLLNNIQTNYITGSTNTNSNISILSGKTNNNLIFRTFTGFSGINLNIGPLNETIQISPDYGTGSTQIARGNHTHRPIDLEYPVFNQSFVSGTSIDFNNEITTIQLSSNQEITITGFTNFKPGKSSFIYISGQPMTETSLNYYTRVGNVVNYGYYIGDANITSINATSFTLTMQNQLINNTTVRQGNILKAVNTVANTPINLTVTSPISATLTGTCSVTANTTGFTIGNNIPLVNTTGFTNFSALNINLNNLIYMGQEIYQITSLLPLEYRFIINNTIDTSTLMNQVIYNTNNIIFNTPSYNLIYNGSYINNNNNIIQITCVNNNTFIINFQNNI